MAPVPPLGGLDPRRRLGVEASAGRSGRILVRIQILSCSTRLIALRGLRSRMSLEETVDYLADELDLERSEHVREVGRSVAALRD